MKRALFTLIALLLLNPCAKAETLKFAQVSDVHYPKAGVTGYEGSKYCIIRTQLTYP